MTTLVDEDVFRLYISMNQPVLVNVAQRTHKLDEQVKDLFACEPVPPSLNKVPQGLPFDVFHQDHNV